jgi:hypothetical protein
MTPSFWRGGSSSNVLTDECRCPRQLCTAVVSSHAGQHGMMLVLAGASRRFGRMTPDTAQQRGALAYRQCQRDGNDSCSKHVVLARDEGKSCASVGITTMLGIKRVLVDPEGRIAGYARFRRSGAENPASGRKMPVSILFGRPPARPDGSALRRHGFDLPSWHVPSISPAPSTRGERPRRLSAGPGLHGHVRLLRPCRRI